MDQDIIEDEQLEFMQNHPTKAIFDYQVSSAERFKRVNNDMFMNGSQDSDSHSPLMVYIRSKSASSKRSAERPGVHQEEAALDPAGVQGLQQAVGTPEAVKKL